MLAARPSSSTSAARVVALRWRAEEDEIDPCSFHPTFPYSAAASAPPPLLFDDTATAVGRLSLLLVGSGGRTGPTTDTGGSHIGGTRSSRTEGGFDGSWGEPRPAPFLFVPSFVSPFLVVGVGWIGGRRRSGLQCYMNAPSVRRWVYAASI